MFDLSTPARRFRFVAVAEAITWGILLVAMVIKRVFDSPGAIFVPGMLHGIVFMLFVAVTAFTAYALKWKPTVIALALVSSLPPFGTLVFEWWARRHGHLAELSPQSEADADALAA